MENTVRYNPNEVFITRELYYKLHNAGVVMRMCTIREAMDDCDDVQMREHLAKQLNREKYKIMQVV